jgi:hypothetical protein
MSLDNVIPLLKTAVTELAALPQGETANAKAVAVNSALDALPTTAAGTNSSEQSNERLTKLEQPFWKTPAGQAAILGVLTSLLALYQAWQHPTPPVPPAPEPRVIVVDKGSGQVVPGYAKPKE